jgi:hypothetical protein
VRDTDTAIDGKVSQKSRLKFMNPAKIEELYRSLSNIPERFLRKAIVTWCKKIASLIDDYVENSYR